MFYNIRQGCRGQTLPHFDLKSVKKKNTLMAIISVVNIKKHFFLCHQQRGQISYKFCPWQTFPATSNVSELGLEG
jgi:hypothetical protein